MTNLIFILAAVLGLAAVVYWFMRNSLMNMLNPIVELDPPEVQKGQKFKVRVLLRPEKNVTIEVIKGNLICRRFDEYKDNWFDKTDIPRINTGKDLARIDFSFGQNQTLEAGKEVKLLGKIPLPSEGMSTEIRGVIQVHWFVNVKIKVAGQPMINLQEELVVLPGQASLEEVDPEELEDLFDPMFDVEMKRKRDEEKLRDIETIEGMEKQKGGVFTAVISEEEERRMKADLEKKPVEQKDLSAAVPENVREKYKVQYRTPFDPTKLQQQSAVTASDYIAGVTSSDSQQMPGDKSLQKKLEDTGPKTPLSSQSTQASPDMYSQRHFTGGTRREQKAIDTTQIPEQYRTRHNLPTSSKDQKIFDESSIPEKYRSGFRKKKDDLPGRPK